EARDIEIASGVKTRHLRRLSTDQRTSRLRAPFCDALHDSSRRVFVKLAGSKIIQEKQRLGALNDNVVDAHRHQVNADGVIKAALDRDLHLCADAIVGGDQDRVDEPRRLEIEQSAETAKLRARSRTSSGSGERADSVHDPIA